MSFHNVRLDPNISYGTEGGPEFKTVVQPTASGHEYRIQRGAQARHRYRFDKSLMLPATWAALLEFYYARRGALHGFRFKDLRDFSTHVNGIGTPTALDEVIGTGDGTEDTFQLFAEYDPSGLNPYIRTLSLPVAGSVLVAVDGTPTTAFSITNPGGLITLNTPPANGEIVTAGCYFDVPVRFVNDQEQLALRAVSNHMNTSLECIEILDEVQFPELTYPGGCSPVIETGQDQHITLHTKLWRFDPTADIDVFLPPPDRLPGGPDIFAVHVIIGASNDATVRDDAGVAVSTAIDAGETVRIGLLRDGSTATWFSY